MAKGISNWRKRDGGRKEGRKDDERKEERWDAEKTMTAEASERGRPNCHRPPCLLLLLAVWWRSWTWWNGGFGLHQSPQRLDVFASPGTPERVQHMGMGFRYGDDRTGGAAGQVARAETSERGYET